MKSLGIIGGMGPLASADLYKKITTLTKATLDSDHIHIYLDSNTAIPDRTKAILYGGESPVPEIQSSAKKLQAMGADILVMPCNTSHYFYNEIQNAVQIPLLNMIEECARRAADLGYHCLGLLATEATVKSKIYETTFARYGLRCVLPDETQQQTVTSLIYDCVKAGNYDYSIQPFQAVVDTLKGQGAEAMLLACTELPIAFEVFSLPGPVLDSTQILAESAIRAAGYEVK